MNEFFVMDGVLFIATDDGYTVSTHRLIEFSCPIDKAVHAKNEIIRMSEAALRLPPDSIPDCFDALSGYLGYGCKKNIPKQVHAMFHPYLQDRKHLRLRRDRHGVRGVPKPHNSVRNQCQLN